MNVAAIASSLSSPVRAAAAPVAADASDASATEAAAQRRKVAGQFEAILVRQLLSKSVGSMLGSDEVAGSVYGDMMTDALAQNLTSGPGLGFGRIIEQQLTPRGAAATAAGATPHSKP